MKTFFKDLICILLLVVLVISVIYIVNEAVFIVKNFDKIMAIFTPKPVYAETHPNCSYYVLKDLPTCFEHYTGYEPQMTLNKKKSEATFTFRGGHTVTIKVQEFAKDFWGLEVSNDVVFPFESVEWLHYICFSAEKESDYYQMSGYGIFYDTDACAHAFETVFERSDIKVVYTPNPTGRGYVVTTSDGTAQVTVTQDHEYYIDSTDGAFCINARVLSQLLYNWEMANVENETVNLGYLN